MRVAHLFAALSWAFHCDHTVHSGIYVAVSRSIVTALKTTGQQMQRCDRCFLLFNEILSASVGGMIRRYAVDRCDAPHRHS